MRTLFDLNAKNIIKTTQMFEREDKVQFYDNVLNHILGTASEDNIIRVQKKVDGNAHWKNE